MMDMALSLLALIGGGLALELFTISQAALGYGEKRGFPLTVHAVDPAEELQAGNPS